MKQGLIRTTGIAAVLAAALAGCGGGSSTASGSGTTTTLSGTAATGAPFVGAAITIIDKTGAEVGSGTAGPDGSFTITLSANAAAPFVLKAVRDDLTLVSVASDTSASTVNITPITNLIASRLSTSGDPEKLAAEVKANPDLLSSTKLTAKIDEVVKLLKPLLDAVGTTVNPLTGKFTADGTGLDRALDSLSIKITPAGTSTTNIEISVKQEATEGTQPQVIQFTNADTTLTPLPAVAADKLVKPGTATLIAALLTKMNACFALPVADRVTTPDTNNQPASTIKADACKEIFYNNDPTTFKSNGRVVGSSGAFGNIFRTAANNLVFDRGTYEFTRDNGDIVIGYRSTDASGNVTYDTFAVRPDNIAAPTKLQQIGNQYNYDGAIKAYHQLRTFVNQSASDYYSTGYVPAVNNTLDNSNNPIFSKVVVTTPKGGTVVLKPKSGYGTLQLEKGVTVTGTSIIRMRSVYASTDKAGQDPATADTHMFFASPAATDAEIAGFAHKSVWKFDYYLAANATATPDATQYYRTRARALTIGELKQRDFANLTDALVSSVASQSSAKGYFPVPTAGLAMDWTVGATALAPISVQVWGGTVTGGVYSATFSDTLAVGSTLRTATVPCVRKSAGDTHCTGAVNVASSYAAGIQLNGMHLFARDPDGREYAHFYATYTIGGGSE
jgi:hypothetical protein